MSYRYYSGGHCHTLPRSHAVRSDICRQPAAVSPPRIFSAMERNSCKVGPLSSVVLIQWLVDTGMSRPDHHKELFKLQSSIWGSSQTFQLNFFPSLHSGFCCPLFHKCWFQGHTSISVLNARLSQSLLSEQSVLQSVPYCPRFEQADKLDRIQTQVYISPSLLSYFCSTHRVFSFYWARFSFIEPLR